jgi:hypothetical protein
MADHQAGVTERRRPKPGLGCGMVDEMWGAGRGRRRGRWNEPGTVSVVGDLQAPTASPWHVVSSPAGDIEAGPHGGLAAKRFARRPNAGYGSEAGPTGSCANASAAGAHESARACTVGAGGGRWRSDCWRKCFALRVSPLARTDGSPVSLLARTDGSPVSLRPGPRAPADEPTGASPARLEPGGGWSARDSLSAPGFQPRVAAAQHPASSRVAAAKFSTRLQPGGPHPPATFPRPRL